MSEDPYNHSLTNMRGLILPNHPHYSVNNRIVPRSNSISNPQQIRLQSQNYIYNHQPIFNMPSSITKSQQYYHQNNVFQARQSKQNYLGSERLKTNPERQSLQKYHKQTFKSFLRDLDNRIQQKQISLNLKCNIPIQQSYKQLLNDAKLNVFTRINSDRDINKRNLSNDYTSHNYSLSKNSNIDRLGLKVRQKLQQSYKYNNNVQNMNKMLAKKYKQNICAGCDYNNKKLTLNNGYSANYPHNYNHLTANNQYSNGYNNRNYNNTTYRRNSKEGWDINKFDTIQNRIKNVLQQSNR